MNTLRDELEKRLFLTSPGIETFLIFQQGFELPEFCAFVTHEDDEAWASLQQELLEPTLAVAANNKMGLMLDVLTWRAHGDFLQKIGRHTSDIESVNARAVRQTHALIDRWRCSNSIDTDDFPVIVTGDIGPRGDGYMAESASANSISARDYHQHQVDALAAANTDVLCALTMTTATETIGIVQAASRAQLSIVVSPTVETDGRLPDGTPIGRFIEKVDNATNGNPLFYMVNCAHPDHLVPSLQAAREQDASWLSRFKGFRANASNKSHEELDNSDTLDRGNVPQLAEKVATMATDFDLRVVGGCCGTDHEHLSEIAKRLVCK